MYIRFSKRLLSASSISQGKFVAASTITTLLGSSLKIEKCFLDVNFYMKETLCNDEFLNNLIYLFELIPSICTRSSDLTLREASCSDSEPRLEHNESISSIKIVLGA